MARAIEEKMILVMTALVLSKSCESALSFPFSQPPRSSSLYYR